jgi:hypothetical protein
LFTVLAIDLTIAILRRNIETSFKEAAVWTVIYVTAAIMLWYLNGQWSTSQAALNFLLVG